MRARPLAGQVNHIHVLERAILLRRVASDQRFALADLIVVVLSGSLWILQPVVGILPIISIALIPWAIRLAAGLKPFQHTSFDRPIVLFLVTAWVGYWAAYDKEAAWSKVWLIVLAVLLYYALAGQPKENFRGVSIILFVIGICLSAYFFLTQDFTNTSGKITLWWINARPQFEWSVIPDDYISGLLVVTGLFVFYWFWETRKFSHAPTTVSSHLFLFLGLVVVLGAFILTASRGIWLAIAAAVGPWILWKVLASSRFALMPGLRSLFPFLILVYLCVTVVFVHVGSARLGESSTQSNYGQNTRSALFWRGVSLVEDFPVTGAGLSSFPGQYSQYILVIPFSYFANSYNVFLDVAIEQGLIGGLIFFFLYFGSIWFISRVIVTTQSSRIRVFSWTCLFALTITIVHGMIYDYLYNGNGTLLLLLPVGVAMTGIVNSSREEDRQGWSPQRVSKGNSTKLFVFTSVVGGALIVSLILGTNRIKSILLANLGAVQMSQVELIDFPTGEWRATAILPQLDLAEASLHAALQADPTNRTANHRLGLISMLRGDFLSAIPYLEKAFQEAPNHRGIMKSLGYCYVWSGNMEQAQVFLVKIPEAKQELAVYVWWWKTQGRDDLSANASLMLSRLEPREINQ